MLNNTKDEIYKRERFKNYTQLFSISVRNIVRRHIVCSLFINTNFGRNRVVKIVFNKTKNINKIIALL